MKANYQKLSFDVRPEFHTDFWVQSDVFGFHWHYHPEIEICYVKQGFGQRIVGESVERFEAGDFVMVGSNLPHCWITDDTFNQSTEQMEIYVIHLDSQKIEQLLQIYEFRHLHQFIDGSKRGYTFDIKDEKTLLVALKEYETTTGFAKTLQLIHLLQTMYLASSKRQLCNSAYIPETGKQVEERVLNVCQYIHDNYRHKITVDELAHIALMNTTAFCRFFKKVMGKTPVEYINELRINAASSELMASDKPINEIAYQNGFLSLSHFNKLFKHYNHKTPSAYRKIFRR